MQVKGKDAVQRVLAVVVIVAMLAVMGIPVTVLVFFAVVAYFVLRAAQSSDRRQIGRIFEFYLAAHEILNHEDRRWYGFEVAEVIERGEAAARSMSDPPPLVFFALGALYYQNGDFDAAADNLTVVVEDDQAAERHRVSPSSELRRYTEVLRKLEREPAEGPLTLAAIRALERSRRHRAAAMLRDSRERSALVPGAEPRPVSGPVAAANLSVTAPGAPVSAPPPIAEVLRDVYEDEKKTA